MLQAFRLENWMGHMALENSYLDMHLLDHWGLLAHESTLFLVPDYHIHPTDPRIICLHLMGPRIIHLFPVGPRITRLHRLLEIFHLQARETRLPMRLREVAQAPPRL